MRKQKSNLLGRVLSMVMAVALLVGVMAVPGYAASTAPTPTDSDTGSSWLGYTYCRVNFSSSDSTYLSKITGVTVNGTAYTKDTSVSNLQSYDSRWSTSASSYTGYSLNLSYSTSLPAEVTVKATGYDDLTFTINSDRTITVGAAEPRVYDSGTSVTVPAEQITVPVEVKNNTTVTFNGVYFTQPLTVEDGSVVYLNNCAFTNAAGDTGIMINTNVLTDGVVGESYSQAIQYTNPSNSSGTLTASANGLPGGLSANSMTVSTAGATGTMTVTGTPTAATQNHLVQVNVNYTGSGSYSFQHTIPYVITVKEQYTVTFDVDGKTTAPDAQQVVEGEKATRPDDPSADGFTFDGWYTDATYTAEFDFDSAITSPTTVYAKWTENTPTTYTITWVNWDNSELEKDENVPSGTIPTFDAENKLERAEDENYTYEFTGWEPEVVAAAANATYKAVYSAIPKQTQPAAVSFDIDKVLTVLAGDQQVPTADFKFTATSTDANAPAITISDISFAASDTLTNGAVTKTGTLTLPAASEFPGAGTYTYTIKETANTYSVNEKESMTYDSTQYTLTIKVCNTGSALTYDSVNGGHVTLTKSDDADIKLDKLTFKNTYDKAVEYTDLTVSKTVAGEHADKSKEFDFSVTFVKAPNAKDSEKPKVNEAEVNYGEAYTFQLKDSESITFSVPVGTTYTVTESAADSYTPKAEVTTDGTKNTTPFTANTGAALTVSDQNTGTGENKAEFTNTYVDNPLTGIVEHNAPFLILMLVAVLAGVGFVFDRRRKRARG